MVGKAMRKIRIPSAIIDIALAAAIMQYRSILGCGFGGV